MHFDSFVNKMYVSWLGGHFNPCNKNHSNDPAVEDRHVGDVARVIIPSNFVSERDVLTFTQIDTQVSTRSNLI